jgi:sugar/nucleoside kinase (ribokinase family)
MTLLFLGDLNLDVRVQPAVDLIAGNEIPGRISLHSGGSAANAAVWAKRTSPDTDVRFVGCVGEDLGGQLLSEELQRSGVDPQLVRRQQGRTKSVVIWIEPTGNRSMVSDRASSLGLSVADFDPVWLTDVTWLHLTGYTLLTDVSRSLFHRLIDECRQRAIRFSFDPSSAGLLGASFQPGHVLDAINGASIVFPNRDEAAFLTGFQEPAQAAKALSEWFPVVVVTCDVDGAWLANRGEMVKLPATPVARAGMVDATGAGDAFAGAFLATYLKRPDPVRAGRAASTAAAQVLSGEGAR